MATFTGKSIPLGQEKSLSLFDFLKITWIWQEQLFGVEIGVIGHWVNSTDLSVSLEKVKKQALIANLMRFSNHVSAPWVDRQHLTGLAKLGEGGEYISIGLPFSQLGRRFLGAWSGNHHVLLKKSRTEDLHWLADHLSNCSGQLILKVTP